MFWFGSSPEGTFLDKSRRGLLRSATLKVKAEAKLTFRNARYGWSVLNLSLNLSLFTKGHA